MQYFVLTQVSIGTYALLFSEIVQYCQNRVYTVPALQTKWVSYLEIASRPGWLNDCFLKAMTVFPIFDNLSIFRLSEMGQQVGVRLVDLLFLREKGYKRETKLLNMLLFIKSNLWKVSLLFQNLAWNYFIFKVRYYFECLFLLELIW